jgi:lipopolysaccharide biosynthesis glycosyltransferase
VKYWITGGDVNYMKMIDVFVKSLLVCSEYKIIVYGFNCDVNIDSPNVIKRRIDFDIDYTKTKADYTKLHFNLKDRDWGNLFIKYKIASDIAKEFPKDDVFCFIDSDVIALSGIDTIFNHTFQNDAFPFL